MKADPKNNPDIDMYKVLTYCSSVVRWRILVKQAEHEESLMKEFLKHLTFHEKKVANILNKMTK